MTLDCGIRKQSRAILIFWLLRAAGAFFHVCGKPHSSARRSACVLSSALIKARGSSHSSHQSGFRASSICSAHCSSDFCKQPRPISRIFKTLETFGRNYKKPLKKHIRSGIMLNKRVKSRCGMPTEKNMPPQTALLKIKKL